ncbi:hypothetical protein [Bradyrhizobium sp. Gha]|nr:hypothetical protein [Bradyrhizobium sp. Gha]
MLSSSSCARPFGYALAAGAMADLWRDAIGTMDISPARSFASWPQLNA